MIHMRTMIFFDNDLTLNLKKKRSRLTFIGPGNTKKNSAFVTRVLKLLDNFRITLGYEA